MEKNEGKPRILRCDIFDHIAQEPEPGTLSSSENELNPIQHFEEKKDQFTEDEIAYLQGFVGGADYLNVQISDEDLTKLFNISVEDLQKYRMYDVGPMK